MGSGSSRLDDDESPSPKVNRTKHRLASLFCGASSSSSSSKREDGRGTESLVHYADDRQLLATKSLSPRNDSIPSSSGVTGFTSHSSQRSGHEGSPESSSSSVESDFARNVSLIESSSKRKCVLGNEEAVSPSGTNAGSKCNQSEGSDIVNESCTGQLLQMNLSPGRHTISNTDDIGSNDLLQMTPEITTSRRLQQEELGFSTFLEEVNAATGNQQSDSSPIPAVSDPGIASQSRGDEAIQEVPPGLGLLVSDSVQARREGSLVHVDVVSISSNVLPSINNDITTREARRNSRRMFWDAFSSRSSRRHTDYPAILFTTEDSDFMGSHRRWLLDIGDDFFEDSIGADPWHSSRRSRFRNDRRRSSRSEFWDRLRGTPTESRHRTACPLDLHPDGSCTCELDEEASALSSISRIVLLAEALFEVLDEIHRQPDSFSLSVLSVPAPESVVDSLPVRTYMKTNATDCGDDPDQCYICLVEYEEGDKIRVLPCHHEYHMSCVDKWLKEIHGVCPLCRGEVRGEGSKEAAETSSEAVLP